MDISFSEGRVYVRWPTFVLYCALKLEERKL